MGKDEQSHIIKIRGRSDLGNSLWNHGSSPPQAPRLLKGTRMKKIELTNGMYALVDDEDYEWLNRWSWYVCTAPRTFYAQRTTAVGGKHAVPRMHREILQPTDSKIWVDHINGNGLDNRRSNLRKCTQSQNLANSSKYSNNTSGFKGVFTNKRCVGQNKWRAQIRHENKAIHIGSFHNVREAARAYDKVAIELFREFARPNFKSSWKK